MEYEISKKFNSAINQADSEWETIHRSFNDEKASEFETKLFRPLIEDARGAVQSLHRLETEMMEAERNINLPIP